MLASLEAQPHQSVRLVRWLPRGGVCIRSCAVPKWFPRTTHGHRNSHSGRNEDRLPLVRCPRPGGVCIGSCAVPRWFPRTRLGHRNSHSGRNEQRSHLPHHLDLRRHHRRHPRLRREGPWAVRRGIAVPQQWCRRSRFLILQRGQRCVVHPVPRQGPRSHRGSVARTEGGVPAYGEDALVRVMNLDTCSDVTCFPPRPGSQRLHWRLNYATWNV